MKKVTWQEMIELSRKELGSFEAKFNLVDPEDDKHEIAFGTFSVKGFNGPPVVEADGAQFVAVDAVEIWAEIV